MRRHRLSYTDAVHRCADDPAFTKPGAHRVAVERKGKEAVKEKYAVSDEGTRRTYMYFGNQPPITSSDYICVPSANKRLLHTSHALIYILCDCIIADGETCRELAVELRFLLFWRAPLRALGQHIFLTRVSRALSRGEQAFH